MAEIKIYFQDLKEKYQEALFGKVQEELLAYGGIAPKGRNESREEFDRRLEQGAEHYINSCNVANRFII